MLRLKTFIIISFLFFGNNIKAQYAINTIWNQANKEYQEQDLETALEDYLQIYNQGYTSFELYYNIGNIYTKLDSVGKAILFYKKAELIEPSNEDLKHNLNIVLAKKINQIEPLLPPFSELVKTRLGKLTHPITWAILSIIFSFGIMALFFLQRRGKINNHSFALGVITLSILIGVTIYLGRISSYVKNIKHGLIVSERAWMYSAPNGDGKELFQLSQGDFLEVQDDFEDWLEIKLDDGSKGWVKNSKVGIIND